MRNSRKNIEKKILPLYDIQLKLTYFMIQRIADSLWNNMMN